MNTVSNLKRSEASATVSANSTLSRARLKLTGLYTLGFALVLFSMSALIYIDFEGDLASDGPQTDGAGEMINNVFGPAFEHLAFIDVSVLLAASVLSYLLAGYTLKPIQKSIEIQRNFLANAAHELRTPLAIMRSDIEVLQLNRTFSREEIDTTLKSNLEEIERLTEMADDLLLIARMDRDIDVVKERLDFSFLAENVTNKMSSLGTAKHVALIFSGKGQLMSMGNRYQLERVLINLLQNAITYTPPGGSVRVELGTADKKAILAVRDTGVGIKSGDVPHVFEKFYKGVDSQGTGLGLSIVSDIIIQHGGDVTVESTEGKGTTFTIRLPLV